MTRPVFLVVCGINGAGKTTLADALAATPELAGLPFLNPDRLSVGYRQDDPALTRDLADMRALRNVVQEVGQLIAGRHSFVSETVGANAAYRRYVEAAKRRATWSAWCSSDCVPRNRASPGWRCVSAWAATQSRSPTSTGGGLRCMPT